MDKRDKDDGEGGSTLAEIQRGCGRSLEMLSGQDCEHALRLALV